ncbi:uncharacterized protein UTRI_02388 [Ustilago trichophora]|uniref:Phosphatidylinositol 4-kinase n=1 Tax=Ustilago trichophora TaxID=86804 RepID=A0A5C3E5Z3_9BASI|nr:uncharacterized protein UTRI_02388 [Ustilago trichophora]
MGRPCLIPNFSYLSEVGASYLDLVLLSRWYLVPSSWSSLLPRFTTHTATVPLSTRTTKTLLMRDMDEESRAHKVSRRKERARLRNCGVAIKRTLLCRLPGTISIPRTSQTPVILRRSSQIARASIKDLPPQHDAFYWTPKRMEQFRLQLERLVVLDFSCAILTAVGQLYDQARYRQGRDQNRRHRQLTFFPHQASQRDSPVSLRMALLPTDLIGLPFSEATREHLLPILSDPAWWQQQSKVSEDLPARPYFDQAKFERQMSVMRGQEVQELQVDKLEKLDGVKVPLDSNGQVLPPSELPESPSSGVSKPATGKPPIPRTISSGLIETERRPIGMRASESYRKALLQAAGTDGAFNDADEQQTDEQPLVQDPQMTNPTAAPDTRKGRAINALHPPTTLGLSIVVVINISAIAVQHDDG